MNKFNELSRFGLELVSTPLKKNERFIRGMNKEYHERMTAHIKESFSDLIDMSYRYTTLDMQEVPKEKGNSSSSNRKKMKFEGKKPVRGKKKNRSTQENSARNVVCFNYQEKGHLINDCEKPKKQIKKNQFVKTSRRSRNAIVVTSQVMELRIARKRDKHK